MSDYVLFDPWINGVEYVGDTSVPVGSIVNLRARFTDSGGGSPAIAGATMRFDMVDSGSNPVPGSPFSAQTDGTGVASVPVAGLPIDVYTVTARFDPLSDIALVAVFGAGDSDGDGIIDSLDNCPTVQNPGQENFDAAAVDNGPGIPGHDGTVPNGDGLGDACDPDDDNDAWEDRFEDIGCGSGPTSPRGDNTNDDNGNGNPAPPMGSDGADNGPSWDTDNDAVLDGYECLNGSDPLDPLSKPPALSDDGADDEGDGLLNGWERRKWGTGIAVAESDGDGLGDCTEAMDANGNGVANNADAVFIKQAFFGIIGKTGDFDINGNGLVTNADAVYVLQAFFGVRPCS